MTVRTSHLTGKNRASWALTLCVGVPGGCRGDQVTGRSQGAHEHGGDLGCAGEQGQAGG